MGGKCRDLKYIQISLQNGRHYISPSYILFFKDILFFKKNLRTDSCFRGYFALWVSFGTSEVILLHGSEILDG